MAFGKFDRPDPMADGNEATTSPMVVGIVRHWTTAALERLVAT